MLVAAEVGWRVEEVTDVQEFAALQGEWNELLHASAADCLFLSWEWLYTWWKHLAADRRLSILAVYHGEQLMALAPVAIRPPRPSFGHPFPVCEFLGSGQVGSDYLDIVSRAGCEAAAVRAVGERLRGERTVCKWTNLVEDCVASDVAVALEREGWSAEQREVNVCPFIRLLGRTWESYLAELGSEHRYNFHRKWKRLNRDFTVRFEQVKDAAECRGAIDLASHLHNARRRGRGDSEAFHTPELVAFHREFVPLALERGWLRLYLLRVNDRPAACLYGFLYGGKFYFYQSGFDPAYERYSLGLVTMGLAIRSAIDEGAGEFDLLHGDEAYKSHWSRERRSLTRIELFPPGLAGRMSQASIRLARISKGVVCRVLNQCQ
jgi:CelD/BcsL family acetyltransferase involved in cellulose biosynthesis